MALPGRNRVLWSLTFLRDIAVQPHDVTPAASRHSTKLVKTLLLKLTVSVALVTTLVAWADLADLGLLGLLLLVLLGRPYLCSRHVTGVLATVISISLVLVALGVAVFLSADHMMDSKATLLKGRVRTAFLHSPFLIRVKGGLKQT